MILQKIALIVAGGKGERMQTDIPKQFIEIHGKPILMHTIEAFIRYNISMKIILVLPLVQLEFWNKLCQKHNFNIEHKIVIGGNTRFESVKNGLALVSGSALVAVHDGVRPLVSIKTISSCFEGAEIHGAAIPVVDLVDSVRQITKSGSVSVDRTSYKLVQTPQIFDAELLINAYEQEFSAVFTDDASVVENMGVNIHMVEGNRENIKITTAFDLILADLLLK